MRGRRRRIPGNNPAEMRNLQHRMNSASQSVDKRPPFVPPEEPVIPASVNMLYGGITTTASSSNSTWSTVTGAGVPVQAGKTYRIRWMLRTYSAAAATGLALRRSLSSATGTVMGWHARGQSNATAVIARSSREGSVDEFIATGNATSTTTESGSYMVETLFVCTGDGTFNLQMRSEVNSSAATIDGDGSYWVAEEWDTPA